MTAKALRERMQPPFIPFGLRTADGDLLRVPHPEFISIDPTEKRTVVVWNGDGGARVIDLDRVRQLEPLNGRRVRKRP